MMIGEERLYRYLKFLFYKGEHQKLLRFFSVTHKTSVLGPEEYFVILSSVYFCQIPCLVVHYIQVALNLYLYKVNSAF